MIINDIERERAELLSYRTDKLKKKIDADYKIEKYARNYLTAKNKDMEAQKLNKQNEIQHKKETSKKYTTGAMVKKEAGLKSKNVYLYSDGGGKEVKEISKVGQRYDVVKEEKSGGVTIDGIMKEKKGVLERLREIGLDD